MFDPTSQYSNIWQCTFTDSNNKQLIELKVPKEISRDFKFNQVFNENTGQPEVFEITCKPLVINVLNGYNGTYFVYGQTGTGKTHTMGVLNRIERGDLGIIPQSVDFILNFL